MRERGYQLTRFADDWTVTCSTRLQAEEVLKVARKILKSLGVELNPEKTRIVHISIGFAFLGYVIRQGKKPLYLPVNKLSSNVRPGGLYARPSDKSLGHFKETIKALTQRKAPVSLLQLITQVNPVIRGWGMYYRRAHIRRLFNQLDRWIVRRLWSFVSKRWRNTCWKVYPERRLYEELGLVNLVAMIPSLESKRKNAHSL